MSARIGPISKVILYVKDMDSQVRFYRDRLGLPLLFHDPGQESFAAEAWVPFDTGPCVLALHSGGAGRLGEDAPKIAFSVRGIESLREALVREGVRMEEIRTAAPGVLVCDGVDPEGNRFSLDEHVS